MTLTHKWMPVIDEDKCSGCGLCVSACGPACLGMDSALAVLTLPEVCGSEEHCIGVCADDAIQMAWLPVDRRYVARKMARPDRPVTQVTEYHTDTSYSRVEDKR